MSPRLTRRRLCLSHGSKTMVSLSCPCQQYSFIQDFILVPTVVYEGLGCGDRNRFECHQHISVDNATVRRERKERLEDQTVVLSKAQGLGMRIVREVKENQERLLTQRQERWPHVVKCAPTFAYWPVRTWQWISSGFGDSDGQWPDWTTGLRLDSFDSTTGLRRSEFLHCGVCLSLVFFSGPVAAFK